MCVIEAFPTLTTERLSLRAPQMRDAQAIARYCGDRDVARMLERVPHPYAVSDAEAFLNHIAVQDSTLEAIFMIEHHAEGPVGVVAFHPTGELYPQLGYWIGKPFWGRGFASEATQAALDWAQRSWGKRAVIAGHFADNPASARVLVKSGFLYTGDVRSVRSAARDEDASVRMMVWLA